jgi:superfamily II DNA or RNA helicase
VQLWPHQEYALQRFAELTAQNAKTVVLTSPTGGGKTVVMGKMAADFSARQLRVLLLTNRRILTSQSSRVLGGLDVGHGVMAAGYDRAAALQRSRSAASRRSTVAALKTNKWDLPPFDLVIVDEAHSNKAAMVQAILSKLRGQGAIVLLVTATPVGLPPADGLIVAGKNSELRKCGALVPCYVFAPDEPS